MIGNIKTFISRLLENRGYTLLKRDRHIQNREGHSTYSFFNEQGNFNYERYKDVQTVGNKAKLQNVWVLESNIEYLSKYLRDVIGEPKFGICHGTRRGKEQEWFRKYLDCEVIGTEISDTASQFPNTIHWDFHEIKDEWLGNVDFIYSNSLDHSHDPAKCINAWAKCLRVGGVCIIEHSSHDEPKNVTELDPFGVDVKVLPYLLLKWNKGLYGIREIISAPEKQHFLTYLEYIIIQRRSRSPRLM